MSPVHVLFNETFQIGSSSTGTTHTLSAEVVQISVDTLHVVSVFFKDGESPKTFVGQVGSIQKLADQIIVVTEDTSSAQTLKSKLFLSKKSPNLTKATLTAPVKVLNSIKVLGLYFS